MNIYTDYLTQVILNILNNAVDILIEADKEDSLIRLSVEVIDDNILIYIRDSGSGIPEENIEYIFEPYFSTKGNNGTGLGLYMSQMIIEKQFHGSINVELSDSGTMFSIQILKV